MKRKTIKSVLAKKFGDFVRSINDPEVRELVSKNSIITGGSIASMLLGEKVSDYDIYFADVHTTRAVAEYYVEKFKEADLNTNIDRSQIRVCTDTDIDPARVRIIIPSVGIAGENVDEQRELIEDYDEGDVGLSSDPVTNEQERAEKERYRPIFLSENAITLSDKVQVIVRFYGEPDQIHENFDFEHCKCYWVSGSRELVLPPSALEALLNKELVYTGSKYPVCSILRMRKFIQRGWQVNAGQIIKMIMQVDDLCLKDIEVLRDQLVGVDVAYFNMFLSSIERRTSEDPDFQVTTPYLIEVLNRIFD